MGLLQSVLGSGKNKAPCLGGGRTQIAALALHEKEEVGAADQFHQDNCKGVEARTQPNDLILTSINMSDNVLDHVQ